MMTPQQKEMLRELLVASLVAARDFGLPHATLQAHARMAGFRLFDEELSAELDYLVKTGMAVEKKSRLSAGAKRWEYTAAALEYCEEKGLV